MIRSILFCVCSSFLLNDWLYASTSLFHGDAWILRIFFHWRISYRYLTCNEFIDFFFIKKYPNSFGIVESNCDNGLFLLHSCLLENVYLNNIQIYMAFYNTLCEYKKSMWKTISLCFLFLLKSFLILTRQSTPPYSIFLA